MFSKTKLFIPIPSKENDPRLKRQKTALPEIMVGPIYGTFGDKNTLENFWLYH